MGQRGLGEAARDGRTRWAEQPAGNRNAPARAAADVSVVAWPRAHDAAASASGRISAGRGAWPRWVADIVSELRKVTWPTRQETTHLTLGGDRGVAAVRRSCSAAPTSRSAGSSSRRSCDSRDCEHRDVARHRSDREQRAEEHSTDHEPDDQADSDCAGSRDRRRGSRTRRAVDDGRAWYIVQTYSGYENKVKTNLDQRVKSHGHGQDRIFDVVIPTEEEIEIRDGQRRDGVARSSSPATCWCRCCMDDDTWYVVRNTPGVTGFAGSTSQTTARGRRRWRTRKSNAHPAADGRRRSRASTSASRWASRCASRTAPFQRLRRARWTRSTSTRARSASWSRCSGATRRWSSTSCRSRSSSQQPSRRRPLLAPHASCGSRLASWTRAARMSADGEESTRGRDAADPGGGGEPRTAGGHGAGPSRHQHHGLREDVQRAHGRDGRATSSRRRSRSSRTARSPSCSRRRRPRTCCARRRASTKGSASQLREPRRQRDARAGPPDRADRSCRTSTPSDIDKAIQQIEGTARSMGIEVK